MLRTLLLSAAALSFAAPASAAFVVTFSGANPIPTPGNDFKSDLNGFGLVDYTTNGATISLDSDANIMFEFFASESGNDDTFSTTGAGALSRTENTSFTSFGAQLIGTQFFTAGSLAGRFNFTSANANAQSATIGQDGFGIFLRRGAVSGFSTNVLWFGYDDQLSLNADDNHDDFIVRATVTAVPEMATWAMMITGVGIAGLALRRRRRSAVAVSMA